jgi:hypothetical protein
MSWQKVKSCAFVLVRPATCWNVNVCANISLWHTFTQNCVKTLESGDFQTDLTFCLWAISLKVHTLVNIGEMRNKIYSSIVVIFWVIVLLSHQKGRIPVPPITIYWYWNFITFILILNLNIYIFYFDALATYTRL